MTNEKAQQMFTSAKGTFRRASKGAKDVWGNVQKKIRSRSEGATTSASTTAPPSSNKNAPWNYPADNKTTPIQQTNGKPAPLAAPEPIEEQQYHQQKPKAPGAVTIDGIDWIEDAADNGFISEAETSSTGAFRRNTNQRNTIAVTQNHATAQHPGLVFLQHSDETKRVLLPERLVTLHDVRQLFLTTFPTTLSKDYLDSPHIRIYIQDPGKNDLFYELDDLRDIKDRSVIRLREHTRPVSPNPPPTPYETPSTPAVAPAPPGYLSEEELNYYSESELDMADYRLRKQMGTGPYYPSAQRGRFSSDLNGTRSNMYYHQPMRPASAVPSGAGIGSRRYYAPPPKPIRPASAGYGPRSSTGSTSSSRSRSPPNLRQLHPMYRPDSYTASGYVSDDAYPADRADSMPRSGSVTPVIDEEARARVITMEKELANLSSVVHSALMSKCVPDSVSKDIDMLRREILGPGYRGSSDVDSASDAGSIGRFSDLSSDKGSLQNGRDHHYGYSGPVNQETKQQMNQLKTHVADIQGELRHLRRMAQVNAQSSRDLLRDTFDKIRTILDSNKSVHDLSPLRSQLELSLGGTEDHLGAERSVLNREMEKHRNGLKQVEQTLIDLERDVEALRQQVVLGQRKLRMNQIESFTNTLTNAGRQAANLKTQFPTLHQRLKTIMSAEMERVVREEKFLKEEPAKMDATLRRCKKLTNTMITMKKLAIVQDPEATPERTIPPYANAVPTPPKSPVRPPTPPRSPPAPVIPPAPDHYQPRSPPQEKTPPAQSEGQNHHVLDTLLEELQTVAKPSDSGSESISASQSSDSDTMKRRYPSPPKTSTPLVNGNGPELHPPVQSQTATPRSRSAMAYDRSRSSTPTSVSSEPINKPPIPPPPARYHTLSSNIRGYTDTDVSELKHQLGDRRPPLAISQTNALVEDPDQKWTRSASSSESINSQEGARSIGLDEPPLKPPPPPPPPRNRQEMLEQRQQELIEKQRHLQSQFHKLQELRQSGGQQNGGPPVYPYAFQRR